MNHDTTEHLGNRATLFGRLKPEVLNQLNAIPHPHLRKYITELLQNKQYFTEITVGDMCAILQLLEYDVTIVNYIGLFDDPQSTSHD